MKKLLLIFLISVLALGNMVQAQDDCSSPIVITIPPASWPFQDLNQTTCDRGNDYGDGEGATCLGDFETGEDILYRIDVTENTTVNITYDPKETELTGLAISTGDCPPEPDCLYFLENWGSNIMSLDNVELTVGTTYYLMIDSDAMEGSSCISDFDLTISEAVEPTGRCCFGESSAPDCADEEIQAICESREDYISWVEGLNCTDDPCQASSEGDNCNNPIVVTIPPEEWPYEDLGQTTCGRLDNYVSNSTCLDGYDGGEDIIYRLDVVEDRWVSITFDPKETSESALAIGEGVCPLGFDCVEEIHSISGNAETISDVFLEAGVTYYIMIDNMPEDDYCIPEFDLTIDQTSAPTGRCCFGDAILPDCADDETMADCEQREDYISWTQGLSCSDYPCPLPGGDSCEDPVELFTAHLPIDSYSESAAGRGNNYDETCLDEYDSGEDIVYRFTNDNEETITLTVYINSALDNWGALIDDTCPPGGTGECLYYYQDTNYEPEHTFSGVIVEPEASIYIMVDANSEEEPVDFEISIFEETNTYPYLPGDANMAAETWPAQTIGGDVTYLVNYFRGLADPCYLDGFYASADATGDCMVVGGDVTYLVNYFRGLADMSYCSDYESAWPTPSDVPTDAPDGWPNCD